MGAGITVDKVNIKIGSDNSSDRTKGLLELMNGGD
jgi:hypothetical protein